MADNTAIEWTDATWNPITGCSVHSAGCTHCYAMKLAGTRLKHHWSRTGLTKDTKAGPVWTGEVRFNEEWLTQPIGWKRPRRIFVCAHADLFHENVPDAWIDRIFAVMALAPQHQFQVLTKRAERMAVYVTKLVSGERSLWREALDTGLPAVRIASLMTNLGWGRFSSTPRKPLPNVWLGVSAEDQKAADERIPHLLATPAAVRWISAEPLLGPIDLTMIPSGQKFGGDDLCIDALAGPPDCQEGEALDWVVAGGESGDGARPMHPDWARSLRDQCQAAGVPFLFKQWGEWFPWLGFNDNEAINDPDPEQTRFDSVIWDVEEERWAHHNGGWCDEQGAENRDDPDQIMGRVGKKAAGRQLDGRTWDEYPTAVIPAKAGTQT